MSDYVEDARMIELLAPLSRLEPVSWRPAKRRRRALRPVLVALIVVAALAGVSVAIADGFGAFDGIGAAQHPQTGADVLAPGTAEWLTGPCLQATPCAFHPWGAVLDSSRLLGRLPTGENVYAITTTGGFLCAVVEPDWSDCDSALTSSQPTTIWPTYDSRRNSVILFGIALDGITAVSLQAGQEEVTVPVQNNLWAYEGDVTLESVTVHYADGATQVVNP